jgi:hypothetical protein
VIDCIRGDELVQRGQFLRIREQVGLLAQLNPSA